MITNIITAMLAHLLAVISPGPDFVLISRNSLKYSRKTGIYSALGLGLGILVHITYVLIGVAYLISKSVILFNLIKFAGAMYLINIGYKSLKPHDHKKIHYMVEKIKDITSIEAIKMGFVTNVTNPKASLFFLSLFTLVINSNTPLLVKIFLGLEMSVVTFIWFAFVAYLFSHHLLKNRIEKMQVTIEKIMGIILIGIGVEVLVSIIRNI